MFCLRVKSLTATFMNFSGSVFPDFHMDHSLFLTFFLSCKLGQIKSYRMVQFGVSCSDTPTTPSDGRKGSLVSGIFDDLGTFAGFLQPFELLQSSFFSQMSCSTRPTFCDILLGRGIVPAARKISTWQRCFSPSFVVVLILSLFASLFQILHRNYFYSIARSMKFNLNPKLFS